MRSRGLPASLLAGVLAGCGGASTPDGGAAPIDFGEVLVGAEAVIRRPLLAAAGLEVTSSRPELTARVLDTESPALELRYAPDAPGVLAATVELTLVGEIAQILTVAGSARWPTFEVAPIEVRPSLARSVDVWVWSELDALLRPASG